MLAFRVIVAAALLVSATGPACAAWREARTKHFIILSEQQPETLKAYAERLERFDAAVRKLRGYADPPLTDGARLTIFDLPSIAAVQKLLPPNSSAAGFYIPRASGAVAFVARRGFEGPRSGNSDHLIQHEYTHHLMLTDPESPLAAWLVEGMAEFFGTAVVDRSGSVKIGLPPQMRAYTILRDLGLSAGDLLAGAKPRDDRERSSVYAKGWLLTHYLAFNPARRPQLGRYVDGLSRGEPAGKAAEAAFGDLKQLDREIDKYGRSTFPALQIAPGAAPEVQIRTLSAGEDAIMPMRIRIDRGLLARDIPAVAEQTRAIAARFPDDPAVQAVLAQVELAAKRFAPAIAAADRTLASEPKHVGAMLTKGRALLEEAREKRSNGDWAEVRRWLVRANRADTENAEPLYLFYQSYLAAGQKPDANAVKGLHYAHELAPHDMGLRFAVVRQRLIDGEVAAAARTFAPIIANPHIDVEKRPALVEAMARMQAGDAPGALAAIRADSQSRGGRED